VLSAALPIGFLITMAVIRTDNGEAAALRQSARLILIGSVIAIAGFAAQMPWPAAVVPYLGVGIMVTSLVPANAVGTPRIPTDIRGSAIGVLQSTIIGSQALGAMLGGLVAAVWSVTAALTVAMVPCVLVAGYALLRPIATEPGPARQEMGEVARTPGQDTRPAPSS
jgi:MFS family permease